VQLKAREENLYLRPWLSSVKIKIKKTSAEGEEQATDVCEGLSRKTGKIVVRKRSIWIDLSCRSTSLGCPVIYGLDDGLEGGKGDGTEGGEALEQTKSDGDHFDGFRPAGHENDVKRILCQSSLLCARG
jgi:hypothetical protein